MHQFTTPSLLQTIWPRWASRQFLSLPIVKTLPPVTFSYSLSPEAVVTRQLRRWMMLWRRSLTRSHKTTSKGLLKSCWNGTTNALQPEEITSNGTKVSCVYYQLKCPYEKNSGYLFNDPRVCIYIYICIYIYSHIDTCVWVCTCVFKQHLPRVKCNKTAVLKLSTSSLNS